ncbi:hypothetical protein DITRI_Ditri03aG0132100 [Diplodiscus trichospermus]
MADSCFCDDLALPPGFRFHPTDEELVLYYLKRKICKRKLKLDIIKETDVYQWDPEELPAQSILKTGDRQWFFFSPRDRKYPNGARSNRATRYGYWKATGKDRNVTCNSRTVGVKKTLVFYRGRAPKGQRTDWVMHEYTLDEEELKRCQNVKDYYALYKVYKKSGPGPKNGEQYGAPFKEEEWGDEEYAISPVDIITSVKPPNEGIPDENVKASGQVQSPLNDVDGFMRQLVDEPVLPQQQTHFGNVLPLIASEEETESTLLDPSRRDVLFPESHRVSHDQVPQICEEDFLEIDDLMGPEPWTSIVEKPEENGRLNEFDGLSEFDLFHDAAMFLQDMGPIDQGTVPFSYDDITNQQLQHQSNIKLMDQQLQPQLNFFGDNQQLQSELNAIGYNQHLQPESNALGDNMLNQVDFQLQFQSAGNELNQHLQMDELNCSFWTHEQSNDVFVPSGSDIGNASPTSGLVCNGINQGQDDNNSGSTSRFSSALWSFVESIPTSPASAAENPLVNRAFERMSSFSRLRLNARNTEGSAINGSATARRKGSNMGFFFIFILGAFCAIIWFLIGTVRVVGRSLSS